MKLCQKIYNTEEMVIHSLHLQCNQNCLLAGQWGSAGSLYCKENVSSAWRMLFGIFCGMNVLSLNSLIFPPSIISLSCHYSRFFCVCIWNAGLTLLFFSELNICGFTTCTTFVLQGILSHLNCYPNICNVSFCRVLFARICFFIFDL